MAIRLPLVATVTTSKQSAPVLHVKNVSHDQKQHFNFVSVGMIKIDLCKISTQR